MENAAVIKCGSVQFGEDKIVYFKKTFSAKKGENFDIKIFADAGYKLYINGKFIGAGPAKGNDKELFYDKRSLGEYLTDGENEILVSVLCLAPAQKTLKHRFITSLRRSGEGVLLISGFLGKERFVTDETWQCAQEMGVSFIKPEFAYYTGIPENVNSTAYKNVKWETACIACDRERWMFCGEPSFWYCTESTLPLQKNEKKEISLSANSVFDNGSLTIAYIKMKIRGKAKIKLTYAERYLSDKSDNREDKSGELIGDSDVIELDGEMIFEPFWFRCFRFIKAEVLGKAEFSEVCIYETGYPLSLSGSYDFYDETDNKLWDISVRTLKNCMTDTFNDCPYYEQLQYAMDTYLQIIYAAQITNDDRLWRRAMRDFAMSVNSQDITQSRTPSTLQQFIPSFSLYYIMMVLSHYDNYGDFSVVDENMPFIMQIFAWYERHSDEYSLVHESEYWHFIDWAEEFGEAHGVPTGEKDAVLGVETLILCYTLGKTARVLSGTVYESLAKEYQRRADKIKQSANKLLYSKEKQLYSNTENKKYFCQHGQIWAVLSGCADGEKAKKIMEKSFSLSGATVSFAYAYFLFRALEKTELYHMRKSMIDSLRNLVSLGCTTVPETPKNARSECHAWGAAVIYEFTAMDLGVKSEKGKLIIKPYTKERCGAEGTVYALGREIYVKWKKVGDELFIYANAKDAKIITDAKTVVCDDNMF